LGDLPPIEGLPTIASTEPTNKQKYVSARRVSHLDGLAGGFVRVWSAGRARFHRETANGGTWSSLYAAKVGFAGLAPHDLRRSCPKLCHSAGGELEQIQFLLEHVSVQTTERYSAANSEFMAL
jgi:integrase